MLTKIAKENVLLFLNNASQGIVLFRSEQYFDFAVILLIFICKKKIVKKAYV